MWFTSQNPRWLNEPRYDVLDDFPRLNRNFPMEEEMQRTLCKNLWAGGTRTWEIRSPAELMPALDTSQYRSIFNKEGEYHHRRKEERNLESQWLEHGGGRVATHTAEHWRRQQKGKKNDENSFREKTKAKYEIWPKICMNKHFAIIIIYESKESHKWSLKSNSPHLHDPTNPEPEPLQESNWPFPPGF